MKKLAFSILLVTSGLISGCSSTSFLYNNADWLMRDKVDDYFSLSNGQESVIEQQIERFFEWHRYQQLPEYALEIQRFNSDYADGLTREELESIYDRVAVARADIARKLLEPTSDFLLTVNEQQLDHYHNGFLERLDDDRERLELSPQEQKNERFEDLLDNLQSWFGSFDDKQLTELRDILDAMPNRYSAWLEHRQQRHDEFLNLMRSSPNRASIQQYLQQRFVEYQHSDAKHQAHRLQRRREWQSAILKFDKLLTPTQRQHAMSRLADYGQDFISLSRQEYTKPRLPKEASR